MTRLAYVTTYDASRISSWSGTPYHMTRALLRAGVQLDYVGPLHKPITPLVRGRQVLERMRGRRYLFDRNPSVLRGYARDVAKQLANLDVDAVLSPGTIPIAYLETDLPTVFWTDATFAVMVDYYPGFSGLCDATVREGNQMEGSAITRSSAAVYSSSWAAESAMDAYEAVPSKVSVIPFGANLADEPDDDQVAEWIESRRGGECRLIFLGVDWRRKGGDRALDVALELSNLGIPTRLTVVGPAATAIPDSELIDYHGHIDKSTPQGEAEIVRLLGESHFLCLPSYADCTPIVLCEASACGVPSISIRTGGIGSVVTDGTNGYLFDEPFSAKAAAESIATCMADYDGSYIPLALTSRTEYRARLNWTSSTRSILGIMATLVA